MLLELSRRSWEVSVLVAMQLEVSGAHMQVAISAANIWVTTFVVIIMHMEVSVACN